MNFQLNNASKSWIKVIFSLLIVIAVGFGLRVYNLTILPVFADEAIYIRWAQIMNAEPTLRFLPLSDGKQPMFHWALMFFVNRFSDPLFVGRMVSVVSGMGTIVGVFTLSYLLFKSKKAALLAAAFWAVSPFSLFFDRMALVDSMLTVFGVWTFIFGYLSVKYARLDMALLAGFSLGGALLTKSPAIFFMLLLPVTLLFADWSKHRLATFVKSVALVSVSWVLGYGFYNILRLGPNFHLLSSRTQDYVYPLSHIFERPLDPLIPHFDRSASWFLTLGPSSIVLIVAAALLVSFKKYKKEILFLIILLLAPIVVQSTFAKVFTTRYILFTVPYLFVLASSVGLVKSKKLVNFVYLLLLLFMVQAVWKNYFILTNPEAASLPRTDRSGYLEEWTSGTGIREVADYLKNDVVANLPAGRQVVVGTEGYFGTLPDGLQAYMQGVESVTVIGVGLDFDRVPEQLVESVMSGNKTYFVVNSSRLLFDDFESKGLTKIAEYKKADRPYGNREYNKHGPFEVLYFFEVVGE